MSDSIRIANCSGFFGDRLSGAKEMVEGGPIDVLTGDWLAELTMLILSRIRAKNPGRGYASTFVTQMEQVMGTCLDRGIKVVSNAGGLDPGGCADALQEIADRLGLNPTIAYVDGDDLLDRAVDLAELLAMALRAPPVSCIPESCMAQHLIFQTRPVRFSSVNILRKTVILCMRIIFPASTCTK